MNMQPGDWVLSIMNAALNGDREAADLLNWQRGWMPRLYRVQHEDDGRGPARTS